MNALLLAVSLLAGASAAKPAPRASASVLAVDSGTLTADGRRALAGTPLADDAALRLGPGQVVLDLPWAGRLLLKGPAELRLGRRALRLISGGLLSVLDRLKGRFEVATPAAVAGVRGTVFFIEPRGPRATYLCLCRGKLLVTGPPGTRGRDRIKSKHHSPFLFTVAGGRLRKIKAPMLYHTDAEIARLFALGRGR